MMKDAREKAVAECESLRAQVAALRQQVEDAQDRSPKMTTLSRMLREQLTAKVIFPSSQASTSLLIFVAALALKV